jgi:hypothetical protein
LTKIAGGLDPSYWKPSRARSPTIAPVPGTKILPF